MDESELYSMAMWSAVTGVAMLVVGFSYRMYLARNNNKVDDDVCTDFDNDGNYDNGSNNNGNTFTEDTAALDRYNSDDSLDSSSSSNNSNKIYDDDDDSNNIDTASSTNSNKIYDDDDDSNNIDTASTPKSKQSED